jgi:hypothetical protein
MTRSSSGLQQARRALYIGQRRIGDYQALRRGGGAYSRRLIRRSATRSIWGPFISGIMRGLGGGR